MKPDMFLPVKLLILYTGVYLYIGEVTGLKQGTGYSCIYISLLHENVMNGNFDWISPEK